MLRISHKAGAWMSEKNPAKSEDALNEGHPATLKSMGDSKKNRGKRREPAKQPSPEPNHENKSSADDMAGY